MKVFSILALLVFCTLSAQAGWRPGFGGGRGPGWGGGNPGWGGGPGFGRNVTCTATDNGWEEHWGGHSSCQECKARHGSCTERCSVTNYKCTATGNSAAGQERFEAYGDDEYRVRDEALRRCYYRGASNCSVNSCDTSQQVVSTRGC